MANTYLTSNLIAKETILRFKTMNSLLKCAYRGNYGDMFNNNTTYAPGNTINLRLPNNFAIQRGDSISADDITEQSVPLTIKPLYSVGITYTPTDLQRDIVSFSDEVLKPAVANLIAAMNIDIYNDALTQVNYFVGDSSTSLSSFANFAQIGSVMRNLEMDMADPYFVCSPNDFYTLASSSTLQNSFVEEVSRGITEDGQLPRLMGYKFVADQAISPFIAGTHTAAGNVTVASAVSSGSSISLTGFTSGATINAGDVFQVEGVYPIGPVTQAAILDQYMQFVVQNTVTADGSGNATITVFPSIDFTSSQKTCYSATSTIPSGAVVTFLDSHYPNFAFPDRALVACFPPMQAMSAPQSSVENDPEFGISMRVSMTADVLQNKNIMRIDCQMASRWMPRMGVRFATVPPASITALANTQGLGVLNSKQIRELQKRKYRVDRI